MGAYVGQLESIPSIKQKKERKKPSKLLKNERRVAFLFILPPVISFIIFTIIPMIVALILALGDFKILTFSYEFVGFKNFIALFDTSKPNGKEFIDSVVNTVVFIIEVPIAIMLGLICATLANSKGCKKSNGVYRVLLYLPTVCSAVAANVIWRVIFLYDANPMHTGVLNSIFDNAVRWTSERVPLLTAIIIKNSINGMGSAMILYYASMCNISKEYYEAAEMDGANGLQRFAHITFPMLTPVTFYLLIMRTAGCLQSYADSAIFAAKSPNARTVVFFIWEYGIYQQNYSLAAAAALVLGVVIMIITIFQFRLSNKWVLDL